MKLKSLTNKEVIKFLKDDPLLCERSLPDDALKDLNNYHLPAGLNTFGIYNNKNIMLGMVFWSQFTETSISMHLFITSQHHGKGLGDRVVQFLLVHWQNTPGIYNILRMIPKVCIHVIASAERNGFKLEGCLTDGVIWRNNVTDLLIYSYRNNKR